MQTLTIKVQDNFIQDFLTIIEHYKDKVHIAQDKFSASEKFKNKLI